MSVDFTPDPQLYPFESRWFESSRGRIHYIDEGEGPPILLCHGNPTWSFLYRDIVVVLRDRFRCIAPDYLGFGLSDRPAGFGYKIDEHAKVVGEFVDHLGLDGYLTMGQDWGGPISMAVAVERADRVRGIVLGNTWFWPADTLTMKAFSRVMSSPPLQHVILHRNFFWAADPGGDSATAKRGRDGALPGCAAQRRGTVGRSRDAQADLGRPSIAGTACPGGAGQAWRQTRPVGLGNEGLRIQARPDDPADAHDFSRSHPRRAAQRQALHPGGCARPDCRGDHRTLRLTAYRSL